MNAESKPESTSNTSANECSISVDELVARLENARQNVSSSEVMIALDADGTCWSGDVGNDLFLALVQAHAVKRAGHAALVREAQEFGIAYSDDPTDTARALFEAHEAGKYPEDRCFAMMAWVFAGMSLPEAVDFSTGVIKESKLEERLHRFLDPVFGWAREENVAIWIVSASPKWMVQLGMALFGIPSDHVIGMTPVIDDGIIQPKLEGLPIYGPNKPVALRQTCPNANLLGGFGDSSYDVALLQMAHVPVAVRPKPSLLARAHELRNLAIIGV